MRNLNVLNKNKYSISGIFLFILIIVSFFTSDALAVDKKVVIFIMDRVNYQDLERGDYPFISQLRQKGAEGLINVRSKALFIPNNSESSYLTIGSGFRVESPDIKRIAVEGEGLRIIKPEGWPQGEKSSEDDNPNAVGLLGQIAREKGLKVGLISSSGGSKPFYGSILMAMDENGIVPDGNISDSLISKDNKIIGGWKTNNKKMLEGFLNLYQKSDIIFVDYSDTNRVYQNKGNQTDVNSAIARGDQFLGSLLKVIDRNAEVILISPNPSNKAIKSLNYSLTPVVIYNADADKGYSLTSNNTRRPGLALNLDLIPTIYNSLGIKVDKDIVGEPIKSIHKTPKLNGFYRELYLTNLSKARIIVHAVFIILLIFVLAYCKLRKDLNIRRILCYTIISYPLAAVIIGSIVSYKWYIFDGFAVLFLAIILGKLFLDLAIKQGHILSLAIIGGLTGLIIVFETFFFPEIIMGTPFGFNDVFIGGRFYGLNNDIMGIMLGSSTLGIFAFFEKYKISNTRSIFIALIFYIILTAVLSPFFGVNVGGSITAMVMLFVSIALLMGIELDWKKAVLLIILVVILQVGISTLDNLFNSEATHAGKAVHSIATRGISKVIQIIISKLSQVIMMVIVPPYNFVLGLQCFILYKYKQKFTKELQSLTEKHPVLYKGSKVLVWGVIAGFLFNDTGVIASGLMLLYLTITITLLIEGDNYEIDKI